MIRRGAAQRRSPRWQPRNRAGMRGGANRKIGERLGEKTPQLSLHLHRAAGSRGATSSAILLLQNADLICMVRASPNCSEARGVKALDGRRLGSERQMTRSSRVAHSPDRDFAVRLHQPSQTTVDSRPSGGNSLCREKLFGSACISEAPTPSTKQSFDPLGRHDPLRLTTVSGTFGTAVTRNGPIFRVLAFPEGRLISEHGLRFSHPTSGSLPIANFQAIPDILLPWLPRPTPPIWA